MQYKKLKILELEKLLRKDKIRTLRQGGGLSGFTKRLESEYDPFGAAHSSTSISSALGIGSWYIFFIVIFFFKTFQIV